MTDKKYEDYVLESGETKRDVDVVYNPIFRAIKTAFSLMFSNDDMSGADFKRMSDMKYFQGGYPSATSPPKEHALAVQVANLIKLEHSIGLNNFSSFLGALGIRCEVTAYPVTDNYTLSTEDEKKLKDAWGSAGIDRDLPAHKPDALELLLDRAQNLQAEICDHLDSIRVTAAEEVEAKFKVSKPNFMRAVGLAAIKLKRGDGVMQEKIDDVIDGTEDLIAAIKPLIRL